MEKIKKIKYALVLFIALFLFSLKANAATLELALEKDITSTKSDVVVLVTINSEDQNVNTAQASISFPTSLLEVIKLDKTDSVLSFWLEEPSFDNTKGLISFVGGSTSGFNGASLKVLKIDFKVKGSGTGRLKVTDGAITASDGTGSNVYNTSKGLDINIPTTSEFQAVKVERAQQEITLAKKLPALPTPNIPFYPDQTKWNNRSSSFVVKWDMGSDIIKAGISLDNKPISTPVESKEALSGTKIFPALTDGIWYMHLRLANNIGWGPTLHYRIAIDTTPPNPFKIINNDGFKTENPKPTINFKSSDLVSGINSYVITLDNVVLFTTVDRTTYQFAPLLPGVHSLNILAIDNANNSTLQSEKLEILPIESPIITYVSKSVIADEGIINAGGTASVKGEIITQLQNNDKQVVYEQTVPVDSSGNWNITISKSLPKGDYQLLATVRDENMASSYPIISETITLKQKPMLVIGILEISQTLFYISLIIILLFSFGAGWFSYRKWREQLERRTIIAQRDVSNILDSLKVDINKLLKNYADGNLSGSDQSEMEFTLKKIRTNLEKSHSYIVDNIREINK
jgi:hypothetical protein